MSKKITAIAPSNIAFIKYWGKKKGYEELRLPENGSISMTLDDTISTTTSVEFDNNLNQDEVEINGKKTDLEDKKAKKVSKHLDRIRKMAGIETRAKVVSTNTFPASTGISSSASSFAALSLAGSKAAGLDLSEKELSILARQGSGSASRSIPGGFVKWHDGNTSESSFAETIFEKEHWDLVDVVAVVSETAKKVSTTEGQALAGTSPFYETRLTKIQAKMDLLENKLRQKDFSTFGQIMEAEALELHAIMITTMPAILHGSGETVSLMRQVYEWRDQGLEVYYTINTGANPHLICQAKDLQTLTNELDKLPYLKKYLVSKSSDGARVIEN